MVKQKKIIVSVDPDLDDLIPLYLENKYNDIAELRSCLEKNDFETIRIIGHSLKGSGSGYGFTALTDIGQAVEAASLVKDRGALMKLIDEFLYYVQHVEVVFE